VAISLVNRAEKYDLDKIAKEFKIEFEERTIPSDADVEAVVAERTTALLEARLRLRDKLQTERSQRFAPLARSLAESEEELPIITMLLDDYYSKRCTPRWCSLRARPALERKPQNRVGGHQSPAEAVSHLN